jgi:cGMP-dependent protein kinase
MGCAQSSGNSADKGQDTKQKAQASPVQDRDKDKKAAKEENKGYQNNLTFLQQVALFKRLPKDQHPLLAAACVPTDFKAGQVVIKQGEPGTEFFVIKSGEAKVTKVNEGETNAVKVASLKQGDYFGEGALLWDEPRAATITAETTLSTLKITREKFQSLGLNEKLQFANRKAVGGGGGRALETKAPSPKTPEERKLMSTALKANENLQTMVSLDDGKIKELTDAAWKETVTAGKMIIEEGDLQADYFYIVQEGAFEIYVSVSDENEGNGTVGEQKLQSTVKQGGSFGELALLYLVPRAATVKAIQNSTVWVIDRNKFKSILMKVSDEKINEYVKYLSRVNVLESLLQDEKKAIAQALVEMHFAQKEVILEQGEPGNTFYILYDGEVKIEKDGKEVSRLKAENKTGTAQFFGERALLDNEGRAATVTVVSETAKALALDRESFNLLLGPLADIIKRSREKGGTGGDKPRTSMVGKGKAPAPSATGPNGKPRDKIQRKDLQRIGLLGCGGFGAVELWEHKVSQETYAMKGLSKGYIVKTGMQESVMNEKNILLMTNSLFIIKLYETYNGSQTLYFLLEKALGGELYATYNRKGFHGSEKHAKFYIAGTVFAFEHMHERRIIYRDLKPENLLLTEEGHLKLIDMGLAKFVIGKTYTTCGTPDYFAPELIASTGHTNAVDWWTLGILIFELMSGHPPFESAYPMQIYSKVMKGISKVPFPVKCQGPVSDLIKGLLKKEPSERLPMRPGGVKNIKECKWFTLTDFDWAAMENLTMDPPYKPVVKSKKDIANFSARKEDMPKQLEYHDDGSGWDKDFATV